MQKDSERIHHWTGLKITNDFKKMGVGRILVCHYGDEQWLDKCPFSVGDSLEYSDDELIPIFFRITGIEMGRNIMDGRIKNIFGLIVRAI